jgi:hypothetical protein
LVQLAAMAMTKELASTAETRRLRDMSKQEIEAFLDKLDHEIEDDGEWERRYDEQEAQWDREYRDELAYLKLPKELEDRLVTAERLREFVPAFWEMSKHKALLDAEDDFKKGKRKLEMDRNAIAAQAGLGFLGILTTLGLDTQSTYTDISLYSLCFAVPLLASRAYVFEKALRDAERPITALMSVRNLVLDAIESVGLGIGILSLVAHYSELAAGVMAVSGVVGAIMTIFPSFERISKSPKP